MMKNLLAVGIVGLGLALTGCDDKPAATTTPSTPVTKAADATKAAADKTVAATKDAAKATSDGMKAANDKVADAAKATADKAADLKDKVADAAKSTMADANKWISDTVEKQWPEAKKNLDAYTAKIADIKDAATKTKAESTSKDLKAQIPTIEAAVQKIKDSAGSADLGKMVTDAKSKFDGFMTKLNDLKGMVK